MRPEAGTKKRHETYVAFASNSISSALAVNVPTGARNRVVVLPDAQLQLSNLGESSPSANRVLRLQPQRFQHLPHNSPFKR
jgi:hypothetical protein